MRVFYTVDRAEAHRNSGLLYSGLTIMASSGYSHLNDASRSALSSLLQGEYSRHGGHYLVDAINMTSHSGHPMEIILELIRQKDFPDKPSRLESMFACLSQQDADSFRKLDPFYAKCPVYEAIPDGSLFHVADMNLLNIDCPAHEFLQRCNLYWSGLSSDTPFWEVVIPLPAVIGDQVS